MENLAFKKETWLNKERHRKRALDGQEVDVILSQKLADKAVDGVITNDIDSCAILDNYYDDEPQLTIDLGARRDVSGVTVYTWQGQQDGKSSIIYFAFKPCINKAPLLNQALCKYFLNQHQWIY